MEEAKDSFKINVSDFEGKFENLKVFPSSVFNVCR